MSRQEREPMSGNPPVSGTETQTRSRVISETRESETGRNPITWEEMRTLMQGAPTRYPARTWRPVTGGVFSIIAGIWNIIVGSGIILGSFTLDVVSPSFLWGAGTYSLVGNSAGIALCILGVISVVGGYMAVSRTSWMLGLIGSIAALVPSPVIAPFVMGVASVVLVSLGRREFEHARETTR